MHSLNTTRLVYSSHIGSQVCCAALMSVKILSYSYSVAAISPFVVVLGWTGSLVAGHTKSGSHNSYQLS